jgi:hypothetical protein
MRVQSVSAIRQLKRRLGLLVGGVFVASVLFQVTTLDGWQGVFLPLFSEDSETVYAPGYSYIAFRKVRIGMRDSEVRELIGEPLKVVAKPAGDVWVYSDSATSRSYRMREVLFDQRGRVVEVMAEFVFD